MSSDRILTGRSIRVIIPTTGVPAEVQSLVREDAEIPPIICINGTARQAGVQAGYRAWVRRPSGLIERLYGHGSFRVDVSSGIDVGDSWQLGLLLAHALEAEGRLSQSLLGEGAPPAQLVWATGEVRPVDLAVCTVGHVEEKVRNSLPLLAAAREAGFACLMLLPDGNAGDLPPDLVAAVARLGIPVRPVGDALAALSALGLELPQAAARERTTPAPWSGNPYRGLESFEPNHRPIFFGRGRAREESLELLRRAAVRGRAFLLIHGRSGIGKSSLAMAGLVGDVLEKAPEGGRWLAATLRFGGGDPFVRLAGAVTATLGGDTEAAATLAAQMRQAPEAAGAGIAELLPSGERCTLLLVADQLEQALVDLGPAEVAALGRCLLSLAECGRVWLVATIRTDRLDLVDGPGLTTLAADERLYRLAAPSLHELIEIIIQPAARAGLVFEAGPSGDLPRDLAAVALASPDSLPLLELVLTRLADIAGPDRTISRALYDRLGGFAGAIGRLADEAVTGLVTAGVPERDIDRVLATLVRIEGESGEALSRSVPMGGFSGHEARVAQALVAARLAVIEGVGDLPARIRLTHETLIRNWDRLDGLVGRLRAGLVLRDRLELAAAEWHAGGRDDALLLRGAARIAAAADLRAQGLLTLGEFALDLVDASQRAARRDEEAQVAALHRARQRSRAALVMVLAMGTLAVSLFFSNMAADTARGVAERTAQNLDATRQELESALAASAWTGVRTASVLAPALAHRGEVADALHTLLEAAQPFESGVVVGPSAYDLDTAYRGPLAETLASARRLETGTLPLDAELVRAGRDVYLHEIAAGRLARFGEDGRLEPIAVDPLRPNRIVALRRLGEADGDLVTVWDDNLTQRFAMTGDRYAVARSIPGPDVATPYPFDARVAADGTVLLSDASQVRAVSSVDEQVWLVDTAAGRSQRVSPYSDYGNWIVDDGAGRFALIPHDEDRILALERGGDSLGVHVEVAGRTRLAAMAGGCDADAPLPADMLEGVGRLAEHYLRDPFTGWRDLRCLPLRSGIVVVARTLDAPYGYAVDFVRPVGNTLDLVAEAMSHLGLGNFTSDSTTLLRAIDADPATGNVAMVFGEEGVVLQPRQGNARPVLVARFPAPFATPIIRLLPGHRLLLAEADTGRYRIQTLGDLPGPGPAFVETAAPPDLAPWRELREVLPGGGDQRVSNRPQRAIAYSGAVNNSVRYHYSLSEDGSLYLTAGDDGVRLYDLAALAAGSAPSEALLTVVSTEPARTAVFDAEDRIVVTADTSVVRRFSIVSGENIEAGARWESTILYRGTNLISAEPDPTGQFLLLAEQPDSYGALVSLCDLASGTLLPGFDPSLRVSEGWFLSDGSLGLAIGPEGSATTHYRLRPVAALLSEARDWLARNAGTLPDPTRSATGEE